MTRIRNFPSLRITPAPPRLILLAGCALFLQSCLLFPPDPPPPRPPPVSEVRVNLDVIYTRESGSSYFEARLFNKDDKRIGLPWGKILLNGKRMWPASFGNYFQLNSNDDDSPFHFHYDSLYTFRILLDSAGPAYICSVRTQKNPMTSYSVSIDGDSARITWVGDKTLDIRLNYTLSRTVNDSMDSVPRSRMFPPPHSGEVRVSLEGYPDFKFHRLETVVNGFVDTAFGSGTIQSMVRLTP
jgi:hypothetical protein